jgi:hypothetical protein
MSTSPLSDQELSRVTRYTTVVLDDSTMMSSSLDVKSLMTKSKVRSFEMCHAYVSKVGSDCFRVPT